VTRDKKFTVVFEESGVVAEVKDTVANPTANNFGTFTIKIKPLTLASFSIKHVAMDGQPLPNSGQRIKVTRDYKALAAVSSNVTTFTLPQPTVTPGGVPAVVNSPIQFEDPWGLTVDSATGRLYVTDVKKQRIFGFDSELRPFLELECPKVDGKDPYPRGLVFLPEQQRLIVVAAGIGQIQVFDASQTPKYLFPYGQGAGDAAGQFKTPRGTCLCPEGGEIAVVDTDNCRIQIYGQAGEFKRVFGEKGRDGAKLFYPASVAYRKSPAGDRQLIVTDCDNFCVKVYNFDTGTHVHTIEQNGQGWKFNGPSGVCVDPYLGNIFITDYRDHSIFVFDHDLKFVTKLGVGQLNGPRGIAVDTKGRLLVADMGNHRLAVF